MRAVYHNCPATRQIFACLISAFISISVELAKEKVVVMQVFAAMYIFTANVYNLAWIVNLLNKIKVCSTAMH